MSEDFQLSEDAPLRYLDPNGTVVYRASGLAACERAVVALANGYPPSPPPASMQAIFEEGKDAEPLIDLAWRKQSGAKVSGRQQTIELEIGEIDDKLVIIRGHIDGIATYQKPMHKFVVDYKKFRDSTWEDFKRKELEVHPSYAWQFSVYMIALNMDAMMVGGHLVDGKISEVHEVPLLIPPFNMKALRKRIIRWERLINTGYDAREVECKQQMYPCPAWKLHDIAEGSEYTIPDDDMGEVAEMYITEWREATAALKGLEKDVTYWNDKKGKAALGLQETLRTLGPEADKAKKLQAKDVVVSRVRKTIPAHMRGEVKQDYFMMKAREQ